MENFTINDILGKHFAKEQLSKEESVQLQQWISGHQDEYDHLKSLVSPSSMDDSFVVDTDKAWSKVSRRLKVSPQPRIIRMRIMKMMAVAAVVTICVIIGTNLRNDSSENTIVKTENEILSYTLPDNSVVTLNKNASIQYNKKDFAHNRNLTLTGEAFFDVAPDKKHPFKVQASTITVRVLGTSFNILSDTNKVCVNVKTGKVEVSSNRQKLTLTPGEEAIWQDNILKKQAHPDPNYLSWKEKKLTFNDTPIEQVAAILGKYYNTRILIQDANENCRITTTFTSETIEQALTEICLLLHSEFRKENDVYILSNFKPVQ